MLTRLRRRAASTGRPADFRPAPARIRVAGGNASAGGYPALADRWS